MSKPDGGPAFPHIHELPLTPEQAKTLYKQEVVYHGMTLRDYFAAAAVQGLLALLSGAKTVPEGLTASIVKSAFDVADAMLAERDK